MQNPFFAKNSKINKKISPKFWCVEHEIALSLFLNLKQSLFLYTETAKSFNSNVILCVSDYFCGDAIIKKTK